jgi:hypothetical protein
MPELHGKITVKLRQENLIRFCSEKIHSFESKRFEIVAIRLFSGKKFILTIFALDKLNKNTTLPQGKLPVKKFKIPLGSLTELAGLSEEFNFTVSDEAYNLDEIEVINK